MTSKHSEIRKYVQTLALTNVAELNTGAVGNLESFYTEKLIWVSIRTKYRFVNLI
jgi:hypothetical protein